MAIKPSGSVISFNGIPLIRDDISYTFTTENFTRNEFSNERLRQALNSDGSFPVYFTLYGGRRLQMTTTCTNTQARPLTPDDANLDLIYNRFNIQRYQLKGAESSVSNLQSIFNTYYTLHQKYLSNFKTHFENVSLSDISYNELLVLQAENFSYLTSIPLTVSGSAIGGSVSNVLITSMSPNLTIDIPQPAEQWSQWSAVIEVRTIVPASSDI